MTQRITHPVEVAIPVYNFPRSHYLTDENRKRYRKVVGHEEGTVNRRGLSVLQKALIVKQKPTIMKSSTTRYKKDRKR